MNAVAFLLSVVVLLMAGDRIRVINWFTARAYANLLLLILAAVGFWGLWAACTGEVPSLVWGLLVAAGLYLVVTRRQWTGGAPQSIKTRPSPLGGPELERFK